MREDMQAVCVFEGNTVFVAAVLWERVNGPVPPKHCVYRTCSMSCCVRPECHRAGLRGSHMVTRGIRGKPVNYVGEGRGRPIRGMSPEAAAMLGLIDAEQYLSRYRDFSNEALS
jgi:hypothetical protein